MCKGGVCFFFSHCLIMGRAQNWPDLRSPTWKFRDIRFVGTDTLSLSYLYLINPWKFHVDLLRTVVTVQSQMFLRLSHLNWPGDLACHDPRLKFSGKVRKECMKKLAKNGGAAAAVFFRYPRKTWSGRLDVSPRPGRGLIDTCQECSLGGMRTFFSADVNTKYENKVRIVVVSHKYNLST